MDYQLGGIQSPSDYRDVPFAAVAQAVTVPDTYKAPISLFYYNQHSLGACFVAGTKVRMADGTYKNIENVKISDEVVDAYGEKQRVTNLFSRRWQGNFYEISVFGIADKIITTPEHPILTDDGFKEAKLLTNKDYVVITANNNIQDKTDYWFEKDEGFLKLLGLYLAEGRIEESEFGGRVAWTFHSKETELIDFVQSTIQRIWGEKSYCYINENKADVRVNKKHIADIFLELGNTGSCSKEINKKLLLLEPGLQKQILIGWLLGDGSFKKEKEIVGTTISKKLNWQMYDICLRNKIMPSYHTSKAKGMHKEAYRLTLHGNDKNTLFPDKYNSLKKRTEDYWRGKFEDKNLIRRIKSVKKLVSNKDINAATVYNLETTGSHTYTANFVSVHNCVGHAGAQDEVKNEYLEKQNVKDYSPRFLYAICKSLDGVQGQGTYPRTMMSVRKNYGTATEATCPNDTTLDHETYCFQRNIRNIPQAAFGEAQNYKIGGYATVLPDAHDIKQAIFQSGGFVALVSITLDWFQYKDGTIPNAQATVGNHEVFFYGYETLADGRLKLHGVNSWGQQWGLNGEFELILEEWQNRFVELLTSVNLPDGWKEEIKNLPPAPTFKHTFNTDLKLGMSGDEVRQLQIALKIEGTFPASIAETGYFGPTTQAAVIGFQHKYGITPAVGFVGPITRTKLNLLYSN